MSRHMAIFSSAQITPKQFHESVTTAGGVLLNKPHSYYTAELANGDARVWVAMDNGQLEDFDLQDAELLRQLGDEPRTLITVEAKDTPDSMALVLDLACHLADQWPIALDDLSSKIFNGRELHEMRRRGRPF